MVFLAPDNRSGDPPERTPLPLSTAVWGSLDRTYLILIVVDEV
jgi:hypothetical protein